MGRVWVEKVSAKGDEMEPEAEPDSNASADRELAAAIEPALNRDDLLQLKLAAAIAAIDLTRDDLISGSTRALHG